MTTTQSVKKMSDEAILERLQKLSKTLGTVEQEAGEQMDSLYKESDQALAALERSGELDSRLTAVSEQAARQVEDELTETEEEIRREEEILDTMPVVTTSENR